MDIPEPDRDQLKAVVGEPDPDPAAGRVLNTMVPFNFDPPDSRNDWVANAAARGNKRARILIWTTLLLWIVVPVAIIAWQSISG